MSGEIGRGLKACPRLNCGAAQDIAVKIEGISLAIIHRIVCISCYGLDSLPHNGSAINRLNYTRMTHRQAYYHEFFLGALFPFINSFLAVFLASIGLC